MATNLAIDGALIEAARTLGHHRTKRAAVTHALEEYIQRLKQCEIIEQLGTIEYDAKRDHKKQRKVA